VTPTVCARRAQINEMCDTFTPCDTNLFCDTTLSPPVCKPQDTDVVLCEGR
jgi:hypothetical protein